LEGYFLSEKKTTSLAAVTSRCLLVLVMLVSVNPSENGALNSKRSLNREELLN
jgi:hypothetical protein